MDSYKNNWPTETARHEPEGFFQWSHASSNMVLDFHGDPIKAKTTVLSDGNHHMALQAVAAQFLEITPDVEDVFYVTLPPGLIKQIVLHGGIHIGNLHLTIRPDIVLSPRLVLHELLETGHVTRLSPFMKNQGNVLLVKKNNPKKITGIADLFRDDIKLFISNPRTERVSHLGYRATLLNTAKAQGLDEVQLAARIDQRGKNIVYGEQIHHREAPVSIIEDKCDVAVVYYHLGLRYQRIFPASLEFIPLGGTKNEPQPDNNNVISETYMGICSKAGEWGQALWDYLLSDPVTKIYEYHGLVRISEKEGSLIHAR